MEIIKRYSESLYDYEPTERLFHISKSKLHQYMVKYSGLSGVKRIRIHDIRHSHASMLIELGVAPLAISERLGHEDIQTTLNTYSHLYPNKQNEIAEMLASRIPPRNRGIIIFAEFGTILVQIEETKKSKTSERPENTGFSEVCLSNCYYSHSPTRAVFGTFCGRKRRKSTGFSLISGWKRCCFRPFFMLLKYFVVISWSEIIGEHFLQNEVENVWFCSSDRRLLPMEALVQPLYHYSQRIMQGGRAGAHYVTWPLAHLRFTITNQSPYQSPY